MSNLLRITDVARRLGVSANTAYTMAQAGTIPAFKLAGLEDFAASLRK